MPSLKPWGLGGRRAFFCNFFVHFGDYYCSSPKDPLLLNGNTPTRTLPCSSPATATSSFLTLSQHYTSNAHMDANNKKKEEEEEEEDEKRVSNGLHVEQPRCPPDPFLDTRHLTLEQMRCQPAPFLGTRRSTLDDGTRCQLDPFLHTRHLTLDVSLRHTKESFKALVDLLCKRCEWNTLHDAMEGMSVFENEDHDDVLSAGFTLAIQRMEKAKEFARAAHTIAQRVRLRVPPSVPLFTTSVKILLCAGFLDQAEQLCQEMKSVGFNADAAMYRAVISGFARAGRLDRALQGYKEMRASGYDPCPETLKAIFNGLAREGRLEEGRNLFQELLLSGFIPKSYPPTLLACAFHGKEGIRKAPEVLQIMKEEGFVFHTASFNSILRALMDLGNKEAAFEFFKAMPGKMNALGQTKEVPNMSSYRILICGLCNFGEINMALEYFREMWVAGFVPSREIFDSLLLGLSRAGMIDEITFVCDCVAKFSVKLSDDVQKLIFCALSKSKGLDKTAILFQRLKDRGCLGRNT